jgi:hypothetical protein
LKVRRPTTQHVQEPHLKQRPEISRHQANRAVNHHKKNGHRTTDDHGGECDPEGVCRPEKRTDHCEELDVASTHRTQQVKRKKKAEAH